MIEPHEGTTWESWKKTLHFAEDAGFSGVRLADHLLPINGHPRPSSLETWTALTYAATETKRVRLGTLVSPVTYRYPPMLARITAQIDVLSGGRLDTCIGAGWNSMEHEAFGYPFPPVGVRVGMLGEAAHILRLLWGGGPVTFQGKHYTLKNATCLPKPLQSPMPLAIGGGGEKRTLRYVANYATEWNGVLCSMPVYRRKREALESHCADLGRNPQNIRRTFLTGMAIGQSDAEVRQHFERCIPWIGRGLPTTPDELQSTRGWVVGTISQAVEQIKAMENEGIEEWFLHHIDQENFDELELIAAKIIPLVR